MNPLHTVHIVYFSGTGGTARFAEHFADAFAKQDVATVVTALSNKPTPTVIADAIVLLYPVYASNAPQPIDEWIAITPQGQGTPVIVLSVSGGGDMSPNTACRVDVIAKLAARGYTVPYERMLVMPSNFITPNSDELNVLLLRAAPVLAQRIVAEVLAGNECHSTPSVGDRAIRWACTAEKHGSRLFGKHLHASNACTNCGWCARNCPRGNITMVDGKPTFDRHCVLCLRCVYGCPTHAIHAGLGGFAVFKDGFDLDALERRTATLTELPSIQVLTQGMMYKGVRVYLQEAAQE